MLTCEEIAVRAIACAPVCDRMNWRRIADSTHAQTPLPVPPAGYDRDEDEAWLDLPEWLEYRRAESRAWSSEDTGWIGLVVSSAASRQWRAAETAYFERIGEARS